MNINQREVLRYLGCPQTEPEPQLLALLERAALALTTSSTPRVLHRCFPLQLMADHRLALGGMQVQSKNLHQNLTGCQQAIVFAATLGASVDQLVRRATLLDMAYAVVLQATAAAAIESVCNQSQQALSEQFAAEGLFLRPRFSPGYGDFSILHQSALLGLLEAPKKIGLTLTDGMMLAPSKSVTAIMGVSDTNQHCEPTGCEACEKRDCQCRRSE